MTKMTRDQARAYHPSVRPIWTPDDFDQTVRDAQAVVAAGKRRLRVVGEDERGTPTFIFSQSRERRARWMDFIAICLLMGFMAALGVVIMLSSAPHAKADDLSPALIDYTITYGPVACNVLDEHPTVGGLQGVMNGVMEHGGWSAYESGQIVGLAVYEFCPEYSPLLDRFVARYGGGSLT